MTASLPPVSTPPTDPAAPPAKPTPISVLTLIGVLVFFGGAVLARVLHSDTDPALGGDVGDTVKALGMLLASFGGPLPVPDLLRRLLGPAGGKILMALLVGGTLVAGSVITPGCSSAPVILDDDKPITLAVDSGPPCKIVGQHTDGETAIQYTAPGTCDPHVSLLWLCRRVRAVLAVGEPEPLVCRSVQR